MIFYPGMADLPADVVQSISKMDEEKRNFFLLEFERQKKQLSMTYLFYCLFGSHFGYLGKWGLQIFFWITLYGFGIWGVIELFNVKNRVTKVNGDLARALLPRFL